MDMIVGNNPGIVAGCNLFGPERFCLFQEDLELDLLVTEDVRVGGPAVLVFCDETGKYPVPVFSRQVNGIKGDPQGVTYVQGIFHVRFPHATAVLRGFMPVFHKQGLYLESLFIQ